MTTIKYSRPQNMQEIAEQLRAMQAANDFTKVNELISDIDWLNKERQEINYEEGLASFNTLESEHNDLLEQYDQLNDKYEELDREQWGKDEYIKELQNEILILEGQLND
ncbi:hypothetical protein [Mammaliicoccus lentus]|uniref:hypothetical protein n=1 Tax=Mammaliicoccus lentus TaxID=42858 RepID=UPI00107174D0|nr:hypothetical protein [Mammaliicoccus lentus]MBF0793316.1 hypothetical protein [Mammaliicoccus lentus]TFV17821.1 hypothetical protein E4T78_01550 [Mammaliicoccus lentus]